MVTKIWFVDDDPINNMICSHLAKLALPGVDVQCFLRAAEALAILSQSAVWRGGQAQRKQGGTTFEEVPATRGACDLELGHDSRHPLIVLALSFVSAFFLQCLVARGMSSA